MNGLFQAGSFFGALLINFVGDRWGRKMAITVPSVLVLISGACLGGAANIAMFLVFRFVSGMGSWMLLGAVPVWMTEIVPPRNRWLLVDIHSAALLTGYFLATWAGFGFYHYHPSAENQWRAPLALQAAPVTVVLCAMYWLPEFPRWLIQNGRHEEAHRILRKLHDPDEATIEIAQIEAQVKVDQTLPVTWLSMVTKPSYRKRTLYAIGLACGIQFTGVLVINSESPNDHLISDIWTFTETT
jgi:MFS family permease